MVVKPTLGEILSVNYRQHPRYQGCVGHWMMNEGGGTQIYDLAGVTNLTLTGPWITNGIQLDVAGYGADGTLSPEYQLALPITLVLWANLLGAADSDAMYFGLIHNNTNTSPWISCAIADGGADGYFYFEWNSAGAFVKASTTVLESSTLGEHVLAAVFTATQRIFYVDGIQRGVVNGTYSNPTYGATALVAIGNFTGVTRKSNFIARQARLYNRAMTASEIQSLYQEPFLEFEDDDDELFSPFIDITTPLTFEGTSNLNG